MILLGLLLAVVCFGAAARGGEKKEKPKGPKVEVYAQPRMALANLGIGGARVTIHVRIVGKMTEEWYCPEVTWFWPDGTKTVRASDCEPWGEAEGTSRPEDHWSQTRIFPAVPEGSNGPVTSGWPVTVRLSKGAKVLTEQVVTVMVVGG